MVGMAIRLVQVDRKLALAFLAQVQKLSPRECLGQ